MNVDVDKILTLHAEEEFKMIKMWLSSTHWESFRKKRLLVLCQMCRNLLCMLCIWRRIRGGFNGNIRVRIARQQKAEKEKDEEWKHLLHMSSDVMTVKRKQENDNLSWELFGFKPHRHYVRIHFVVCAMRVRWCRRRANEQAAAPVEAFQRSWEKKKDMCGLNVAIFHRTHKTQQIHIPKFSYKS